MNFKEHPTNHIAGQQSNLLKKVAQFSFGGESADEGAYRFFHDEDGNMRGYELELGGNMSYLGGIVIADKEEAQRRKILKRGLNAVEKGKYLAVFTGGGFRLYDKTDYSLLIKETGMGYVYDGEFSDDLRLFAMKSWDGYAIFYDLTEGRKSRKLSLLDRKKQWDTSADCGCTFGATWKWFYDIVYSDSHFISVVNRYNTETMEREETYFEDAYFNLSDMGYSKKEEAFWVLGNERLEYGLKKGRWDFSDNSGLFVLWTKDFMEYERYPLEEGDRFIGAMVYDEQAETFLAWDTMGEYLVYSRTGKRLR